MDFEKTARTLLGDGADDALVASVAWALHTAYGDGLQAGIEAMTTPLGSNREGAKTLDFVRFRRVPKG